MVTARRVGRWALYGVVGCLALLVLFRVGLGIYLVTPAGKAMVARKIKAQIGMPVEVTNVRVGLVTSTIGLRVFDPAAPEPAKSEVLAVENADADVSLFGLAFGRVAPERVELKGVNLTLHVDADGKVVTTLPKTPEGEGRGEVPVVKLTGGRLTIRQDGRPEFALENLDLTVEPAGRSVKLSGAIDDPRWSKWTVSGDINRDTNTGWVELATPDGPLAMDRLESIPFVPPVVWRNVRADGRAAATVRLWTESDHQVRYSVDIKPHAASVSLPPASVTLAKVTGLIRVSGAKVTLAGTRAELAGGTIAADGELDFGLEPTTVGLKVAGENLDIQRLPPEWGLPKEFEGKLKGAAELTLRIHSDGRIEPYGGGEGAITEVEVLGFPADDIPIHLRKAGDRYEFQQPRKDALRHRPRVTVPIRAAAPRQEKKPDDKKPPRKEGPTTLDATIRLRDIEIAQLLDKLNVKLGYKISGKVSVEAAVEVPLERAGSQAAYRFTGRVSSPALNLEGLTVRNLSANMVYQDGKLTLTELSGRIDQPGAPDAPPGTFRGTASAETSPPGDVSAALTLDRIPIGELLKALPDLKLEGRGVVAGKATFKVPYEKLEDPTAWSGSAELSSGELVVEGRAAKDVRFSAAVEKGVVTLSDARLTLEGIPVRAEGTMKLSEKYPFTAVIRSTGTDVTDLRKLVPEVEIGGPVEGALETETRVTGTASPFTFAASGTVKASKLTLGRTTANQIALKWEVTREKFAVSDLKADAFGGTVTGSADVPLNREKTGAFKVEFKDVDSAAATELVPEFPVKIAGKVSGKVAGTIPPAKGNQPRVGNLDLDLTAPKLTVQGIPAERLVGKAAVKAGTVEYLLEGKTLGGSFEIKGRYPGGRKDVPPAGLVKDDRGSFRLTGIDLARIAPDVGFRALAPLRGRLDANFEFENDLSAGFGRLTVTGLHWGSTLVARELTGVLRLRDGIVELSEVSGRMAGGQLSARGHLRLHDTRRNVFTIALSGADAKRLLGPFTDAAGVLDGPVNLVVHGQLGSEMRGEGTLTLLRGTVAGVQVSDLRVPFEFASAPAGFGQVTIREASVSAGSGRVRGELTVNWGTTTRVEGHLRFTNVPLRALVPELGEYALIGNGRITGRFDLAGRNVRSADDLTGTLVATLNNTSVREVPILRQTTPYLNPAGLTKPFEAGDVRADLRNGVFRVQRLALANPGAQLFAEGTIALSGRLDLNVVAHTGAIGPGVRALRVFGLRVPAVGPLPLTLIRDVSDFLSNRTVRLSVSGTTGNPIVRVNVGALLAEEAVRFFLTRYVLPGEAAGALGAGAGAGVGLGTMDNRR